MSTTQNLMGKKTFFLASYLLLLSFGLLSFWSSIAEFTMFQLSIFTPVGNTLLISVVLTYLSFQSVLLTLQLLAYLVSLFLISSISFPLLHLGWTEEIISAFVYLMALGSILGLLVLHREAGVRRALTLPISYSCLFLLLLLITQAVPALYRGMFFILGLGQLVAFLLCYLYRLGFPVSSVTDKEQYLGATVYNSTGRTIFIYVLLILISWVYLSKEFSFFILIALLFIFSLCLLAALLNSLAASLSIHSIISLLWLPLCLLNYYFTFSTAELLIGSLLFLSLGAHLFLLRTTIINKVGLPLYLQLAIIFLAGLLPLINESSDLQRIAIIFISAYSVIQGLSFIIFPNNWITKLTKKMISPTTLEVKKADDAATEKHGEIEQQSMVDVSAAEREKELTLVYKEWLVKKGEKLGVNFLQKK